MSFSQDLRFFTREAASVEAHEAFRGVRGPDDAMIRHIKIVKFLLKNLHNNRKYTIFAIPNMKYDELHNLG